MLLKIAGEQKRKEGEKERERERERKRERGRPRLINLHTVTKIETEKADKRKVPTADQPDSKKS